MHLLQIPPTEVGADEARQTADQVLSGRAYVEAARPPSLQERLFDWLGERFADLFNLLSSGGGRGWTAWIIIALFGALIVFLLSRLLRNSVPSPAKVVIEGPEIDVIGDRSADEWLAAARDAEEAGDWRIAVRCRHRALVTTLVRRGVVAARPGQTAGEISLVVAEKMPPAAEAMQEATWLFKDTWYGWIDATADSSARFAELADQVLASDLVPA